VGAQFKAMEAVASCKRKVGKSETETYYMIIIYQDISAGALKPNMNKKVAYMTSN
jgi:hypothetical protein